MVKRRLRKFYTDFDDDTFDWVKEIQVRCGEKSLGWIDYPQDKAALSWRASTIGYELLLSNEGYSFIDEKDKHLYNWRDRSGMLNPKGHYLLTVNFQPVDSAIGVMFDPEIYGTHER